MRVLVTAFEPFDGDTVNSSLEVARALHPVGGVELETAELPVVWDRAREAIGEHLDRVEPDVVVALGQTNAGVIGVERIAVNLDDPKATSSTTSSMAWRTRSRTGHRRSAVSFTSRRSRTRF